MRKLSLLTLIVFGAAALTEPPPQKHGCYFQAENMVYHSDGAYYGLGTVNCFSAVVRDDMIIQVRLKNVDPQFGILLNNSSASGVSERATHPEYVFGDYQLSRDGSEWIGIDRKNGTRIQASFKAGTNVTGATLSIRYDDPEAAGGNVWKD